MDKSGNEGRHRMASQAIGLDTGNGRFSGRLALVTGASKGIGFAISQRLVKEGATVVMTARSEDTLKEAAKAVGTQAVPVVGSIDDEGHREEVRATLSRLGPLDHLVNNVGVNPVYGNMMDLENSASRKILNTNVLGVFEMTRMAVRAGLRQTRGSIVNISSLAGVTASHGIGMYGVSKAAVVGLTQQLAAELAPEVRVNAVAPAAVKTDFARAIYEGREAELSAKYPLARLGEPQDVSGPVIFLLSDDAAWITGQRILIDGGATLVAAG
ncbi:SDR family oxidoreductase [Ancrocorticia sp.]|uniref:SDR family oxidoreductase n=1 Tax=Ancrocorticia sp. TaxID=2593684 RepID=UPI003F8E7A3F